VRHEDGDLRVRLGETDEGAQLVRDSFHVFAQEVLRDRARARTLERKVPIAPHQIADVEKLPSLGRADVVEQMTRGVAVASDGDDARSQFGQAVEAVHREPVEVVDREAQRVGVFELDLVSPAESGLLLRSDMGACEQIAGVHGIGEATEVIAVHMGDQDPVRARERPLQALPLDFVEGGVGAEQRMVRLRPEGRVDYHVSGGVPEL
jgi:hypothetical protein